MTTLCKALLSILIIFLNVAASRAASPPMSLLQDTEIFEDVILLSHLQLPSGTALSPRLPPDQAGKAQSSQRGTSCGSGAAALAPGREKTRPATNVAANISATRMKRLVTRKEVLEAIQSFLTPPQNGSPRFRLQDVYFGSAIWISVAEPQLEVTQGKVDPLTGCSRFRLRASAAPELLPFYVTICAVRFIEKNTSRPQIALARLSTESHPLANPSPFLVEPGHPARLLVSSPDSQMNLIVHPLQRGRLGETVRVRLEGSVKTLTGQVTGLAHLDQTY